MRKISIEEFDPVGTLAVTGVYFLLLLVLYALMYFVEFAASWILPVGQRPDALTVTVATKVSADSTATASRTVKVGHVPIRQQ